MDDRHGPDVAVGRADGPDRLRGRRPRPARARSRRPSTTCGSLARKAAAGPDRRPAAGRRLGRRWSPPWASTSRRAMARPSPEPRDASPFTNRSKTCGQHRRIDARAGVADLETDPATRPRPRRRPSPARRPACGAARWPRDWPAPRGSGPDRPRGSGGRLDAAVSWTPAAAAAGSNERTTSPTSTSGSVGSGWSGKRAGLGQRERPQVVDQPAQDAGLLEDRRRDAPDRADRRRRRSPRGCPG